MATRTRGARVFGAIISVALLGSACSSASPTTSPVSAAPATSAATPATAAPATASATAPSASPSGAAVGGTLTILSQWTPEAPEYPILQAVADKLRAQGIEVTITPNSGTDIQNVFEASTLAGKAADIVIAPLVDKSINWVANGITADVKPLLTEWGLLDAVNADAISFMSSEQGQVRAVPYEGYIWPVWYNTELLTSAGVTSVPKTTDELLAAAKKLAAAKIAPFVVGGSDWSGQKLFEQIVQSQLTDEQSADVLSKGGWCGNANAMKGIELFVQLRDAGLFVDGVAGYTADQMTAAYYGKKVAMMSAGSWSFAPTPAGVMATTTLAGLPLPAGSPHASPTDYQGWGGAFHISTTGATTHKDAVGAFVKAMYDPAILARIAAEANSFPAGSLPAGTKIAQPLMQQAVALGTGVTSLIVPDTLVPGAAAQPMIRATSLAYSPKKDAQAVCQALDEAYKQ